MTYTIADESGLPNDECYFVRILTDPTLLIHSKSGALYRRADGLRWQYSGWKHERNRSGELEKRPAFCFADHREYAPAAA